MANETKAKTAGILGGKKLVTQSKVTMNFARHKSDFNFGKVALVALIIIVATLLFTKFAILDPLDQKTQALNELSSKQTQMDILNAKLAGWDELQALYGRYSYGWMTEDETNLVERMDILRLMEKKILPRARIEDFSISQNVLTVNLEGITLEQTSSLVTLLEEDPLVQSATVYKASNDDDAIKEVNLVVILAKEVSENG